MRYAISKVDVWAGPIKDRPGGLAQKLNALSSAKANLDFVIARRAPEKRGTGVVFLAPLKKASQTRAARKAGLKKADRLHSLRLVGPDRPGLGAKISLALAAADINMRGLSAAALNRRSVVYFAFDTRADANKAERILKKLLK
ncbi:MAG: amino acid-binding protein [Candidatus Binatia bacterium]